jgi:hypothetical protein
MLYSISLKAADLMKQALNMNYEGLRLQSEGTTTKMYTYGAHNEDVTVTVGPGKRVIKYTRPELSVTGIYSVLVKADLIKLSFTDGYVVLTAEGIS